MQELGWNFNDLLARPPRPDSRGVGESIAAFDGAVEGSAASAIPVDQEAESEFEGSPDDFIVQANPSARQGAIGGKRSLEADVATGSGAVPKGPYRACTLRPSKIQS